MAFPEFFADVPSVRVRDSLSQFLGATPDGVMDYHYADAVRLAGHSCPTVAGAWLSARAGLKALYPDGLPERGNISVYLPEAEDVGVTGVIGQVLTLVTGAAGDNGFKGLGGQYGRKALLHYAADGVAGMRFKRNDTGATVEVQLDMRTVPADPRQPVLLGALMHGEASDAQRREFGDLWQDRVRRLLLEHADDSAVVRVRPIH